MEFRIGLNLGDVVVEGERIYGDGVNIAARLESLAEAGEICISGAVYEQIKNKLALHYEDLGEQALKNIAEPVQVWRVQISEMADVETPRRGVSTPHSPGQTQTLPLPDKPSIVALPFVNLSSDPEQEYFSDGITEDLTTDLSKLSGLFVIARNSAFTYKGKAVKVQEVGKELGVRYVLEGSVRKAGNRVRITVQLIDSTTGYHLWSERYDRELKDIFALQDEIVQKIVTTLKLQLTLQEQGSVVRKTTDNLAAYDCYLRGTELLYRLTKEANAQARQLYEKAVELDPTYALGYTGLALTYWFAWFVQWSPAPQTLERAFELAQKAVALDEALPRAHLTLGHVYLMRKQYEQAIAEMERAITLDPSFADGYAHLGQILCSAGRPEEAVGLVKKAMRLNPHHPYQYSFNLGWAYVLLGRYEEAITPLKQTLSRNPNFLSAHRALAACSSELGREAEAQAEAEAVLRLSPNFSLEDFKQRFPLKSAAALERYVAALRKAGLR